MFCRIRINVGVQGSEGFPDYSSFSIAPCPDSERNPDSCILKIRTKAIVVQMLGTLLVARQLAPCKLGIWVTETQGVPCDCQITLMMGLWLPKSSDCLRMSLGALVDSPHSSGVATPAKEAMLTDAWKRSGMPGQALKVKIFWFGQAKLKGG